MGLPGRNPSGDHMTIATVFKPQVAAVRGKYITSGLIGQPNMSYPGVQTIYMLTSYTTIQYCGIVGMVNCR